MKKNYDYVAMLVTACGGIVLVVLLLLVGSGFFHEDSVETKAVEPFDTSVIEAQWCGGSDDGTVRMVGAWWFANGVVEDELGQLWVIEETVGQEEFLLLWIVDNHTPEDFTDDVVVKVWREAY